MPGCRPIGSPTSGPVPVTTLRTPAGRPASSGEVGDAQRGERGLLGRLDDEGAAGGERGADLPREHEQREVPRQHEADDADRLAHHEGDVVGRGGRELVVDLVDQPPRASGGTSPSRAGRRSGSRRSSCRCRGSPAPKARRCSLRSARRGGAARPCGRWGGSSTSRRKRHGRPKPRRRRPPVRRRAGGRSPRRSRGSPCRRCAPSGRRPSRRR